METYGHTVTESTNRQQAQSKGKRTGTFENPSATGENPHLKPMQQQNLDAHWGGKSDHSGEYPEYTKEQYHKRATELARSSTSETVHGYKTADGTIVRFDVISGDFVKSGELGIRTMFKPRRGLDYFKHKIIEDGGRQDD